MIIINRINIFILILVNIVMILNHKYNCRFWRVYESVCLFTAHFLHKKQKVEENKHRIRT